MADRPARIKPWLRWSIAATAAIALSASAFYAGTLAKSPEQRAADAAPPARSIVTVPIESRTLQSTLNVWCSPGYANNGEVDIADEPGASIQVITAVGLSKKFEVSSGKLILGINNRPRIAAQVGIPLFRDLGSGDNGADVKSLQQFLVKQGFATVKTSGTYDFRTGFAVDALYRRNGYIPDGSTRPGDGYGARVNAREIVDISSQTVRIESDELRVGNIVAGLKLNTLSGEKGLTCVFDSADIPVDLKVGDRALLASDRSALGSVLFSTPGVLADAGDATVVPRVATSFVSTAERPDFASDVPVQVQIVTGESAPDALVVPASALWTKAGETRVTVSDGDDLLDVTVEVLFSAGGESAIAAIGGSRISPGDLVVVSEAR